MALIYHERQQSSLCGKHCLNNLLQGSMFDQEMMHRIAARVEKAEQCLLFEDVTGFSDHQSVRGDFSIEVLLSALGRVRLSLIAARHPDAIQCIADKAFRGVIVQRYNHWFSLRKIGSTWLNLDSMQEMPTVLPTTQLLRLLSDSPPENNAFLVVGDLPPPETPRLEDPWVRLSEMSPEETENAVSFEYLKNKIQHLDSAERHHDHLRESRSRNPTKCEQLANLGYDTSEVKIALGLCDDNLQNARGLLDAPRLSLDQNGSDTQITNQINTMVKEIYRADNSAQVLKAFFQLYRLSTMSTVRKKILFSSLRDALDGKRAIDGFLSRSARDEIHRFFKQLEAENPMYQQCKDMRLTDLEARCALLLYPTQLDEALDILMQERSNPVELFDLLKSSTCAKNAKAFLLRVVQVAAGNPAETPTDVFLQALRGQKHNLGVSGLAVASRLLEYLDHHATPSVDQALQSTVFPSSDEKGVVSSSTERTPSYSSTALPHNKQDVIAPRVDRTTEMIGGTHAIDKRSGGNALSAGSGVGRQWLSGTDYWKAIEREQETCSIRIHGMWHGEREQRAEHKVRERETDQILRIESRKLAEKEQQREELEYRRRAEERARVIEMQRWKTGVRNNGPNESISSVQAGNISASSTDAPINGSARCDTDSRSSPPGRIRGEHSDMRIPAPKSSILASQRSYSRDITMLGSERINSDKPTRARYDGNRYLASGVNPVIEQGHGPFEKRHADSRTSMQSFNADGHLRASPLESHYR